MATNPPNIAEIKKLQQSLIDAGYDLGPEGADGTWGKKSREAFKAYSAVADNPELSFPLSSREDFDARLQESVTDLNTRFTDPATGKRYKEWDPAVSGYIDNELFGAVGHTPARSQADQRGQQSFLDFLGKDIDFSTKKNKEGLQKSKRATQDYMGDAWSAAAVSKMAMAADPNFRGAPSHSSYIGNTIRGEMPGWSSSELTDDYAYRKGDILFGARTNAPYEPYSYYADKANNNENYESHGDVITDMGKNPDGTMWYDTTGGNLSNTLQTATRRSAAELNKRYAGAMSYQGEYASENQAPIANLNPDTSQVSPLAPTGDLTASVDPLVTPNTTVLDTTSSHIPSSDTPITKRRKKRARDMRDPTNAVHVEGMEEGSVSTHVMVDDIKDNTTGEYHVWPSITLDDSKGGYSNQSFDEARKAGEIFGFNNQGRANRFAHGSWKNRNYNTTNLDTPSSQVPSSSPSHGTGAQSSVGIYQPGVTQPVVTQTGVTQTGVTPTGQGPERTSGPRAKMTPELQGVPSADPTFYPAGVPARVPPVSGPLGIGSQDILSMLEKAPGHQFPTHSPNTYPTKWDTSQLYPEIGAPATPTPFVDYNTTLQGPNSVTGPAAYAEALKAEAKPGSSGLGQLAVAGGNALGSVMDTSENDDIRKASGAVQGATKVGAGLLTAASLAGSSALAGTTVAAASTALLATPLAPLLIAGAGVGYFAKKRKMEKEEEAATLAKQEYDHTQTVAQVSSDKDYSRQMAQTYSGEGNSNQGFYAKYGGPTGIPEEAKSGKHGEYGDEVASVDSWYKKYIASDNYQNLVDRWPAELRNNVVGRYPVNGLQFNPENITIGPSNWGVGVHQRWGRGGSDDTININPSEMQDSDFGTILAHEYGHIDQRRFSTGNRDLDREMTSRFVRPMGMPKANYDHDRKVGEIRSDVMAMRYLLDKEGIYDSSKGAPFTPGLWKKLQESPSGQGDKLRLLKNFSPDKAAWLMNNVASLDSSGKGEAMLQAKFGGPTNSVSNVEGGEMVFASPQDRPKAINKGNFNQVSKNLFKANGPRHTAGGIDTIGARQPFVDAQGQNQNSPYVFSDSKDMALDVAQTLQILGMIS